jgi:hypothetical protein
MARAQRFQKKIKKILKNTPTGFLLKGIYKKIPFFGMATENVK